MTQLSDRPSSRLLPAWVVNLIILALIAALWPINGFLHSQFNAYVMNVLILIGINIVLATSLNLINGITGQFSLGHAGFMAVGAYTTGVLVNYYHPSGWRIAEAMLGFVAVGGVIAAIMGLVVGVPTLRLRGDYLAIATLGFGEIIRIVIRNTEWIGPFELRGPRGLRVPVVTEETEFFWIYLWVILCVACMWRLVHSIKGKAFLAIREDEIAATAMGVNTTWYKVLAFVIGAFFAGVAGGLSATRVFLIDPEAFGFMQSVEIVVMVVLGGSGSITGVILAAALLTWLPEQLRALHDWRMVIYSLLLILMMLVRPEGLLGRRELWWTRRRLGPSKARIV